MKKSYLVLRDAIHKAGVKKVADELQVSPSLIYKWCQAAENPDHWLSSGTKNPLDRIGRIYHVTEDDAIIHWVCQLADGYYVPNPTASQARADARVINNIHKIIKKFSETLDAISRSYDDDKKISLQEAKTIRSEWEELKSTGEAFVRASELGKFNK